MDDESKPVRVQPARRRGGRWVAIGEEEYQVAPLGFLSLQELGEDIQSLQKIAGMPTREQMAVVVRIVHAGLARNYDVTEDQVAGMLDVENYGRIISAVLGIAGLERASGPPSGEPRAMSTGPESTSP